MQPVNRVIRQPCGSISEYTGDSKIQVCWFLSVIFMEYIWDKSIEPAKEMCRIHDSVCEIVGNVEQAISAVICNTERTEEIEHRRMRDSLFTFL
ncbi:hypothetical protein EG68_03852 [Paragonimus skrjabini miyazakii]|uniref:Uncharacterized protein n=1 Tax=Paragonimus skrjabini miyazakii TaxID=59628 RepID=A0A8S9YUT5_9TREM|nr:hypothetical protein EG68_03852 [Paragonimus skrjabini miyazakii]